MGASVAHKVMYDDGEPYHEMGKYIDVMEALDVLVTDKRIWVMVGEGERLSSEASDELWKIDERNNYWIIGSFRTWHLNHEVRRGDYILTLLLQSGKYHKPDINVIKGFITLSDGSRVTVGRDENIIESYGPYEGAFFPRNKKESVGKFYEMVKCWAKAQPQNQGCTLYNMTGFVELSTLYEFAKQQGMEK